MFFFCVLLRDINEQNSGDIAQKRGGVHSGLCSCISTVTRQPSRMVLSFFPFSFFLSPFLFFFCFTFNDLFFFRAHMRAHTSESSRGASHDHFTYQKKKEPHIFHVYTGYSSNANQSTKQPNINNRKKERKEKRERTSLRISLSECLALTHGAA